MNTYRKDMKRICCCISTAVLASGSVQPYAEIVHAREGETDDAGTMEFEGVTQLVSQDWYLDEDVSEIELVVEEVLTEAGSAVSEGDQLLKLTQESYEEACSYYEAAVIRAGEELTDMQLAYDQGMLEAEYTYESAKTKGDQAELVKTYQEEELADTITEHEEVLEEIKERMEELEAGIAAGSYGSGGSSASSGATGGAGNAGQSPQSEKTEKDTVQDGQSESGDSLKEETQDQTQAESGDGLEEDQDQTQAESGDGLEEDQDQTQAESGDGLEEDQDQTQAENGDGLEEDQDLTQPESGDTSDGTEEQENETEEDIAAIQSQIGEKQEAYQEVLKQLEASLNVTQGNSQEQVQALLEQLQSSIDGDTNVRTNLENVRQNLSTVPEEVWEVVKAAYPEYQKYVTLLDSCIAQLGTDIEQQEAVKAVVSAAQDQETDDIQASVSDTTVLLLTQLTQIVTEKDGLYQKLITLQEKEIDRLRTAVQEENEGSQQGGAQTESEGSQQGGAQAEGEGSQQGGAQAESGKNQGNFGGSSGGNVSFGAADVSDNSSVSPDTEENKLSDDEISLFGDSYDLTFVKEMLEREPSDSEAAQELVDELSQQLESVQRQYEELVRNKKITQLGIQYTYDTAVLAGTLAEFTWKQAKQEWEEKLAQAESEKADMERKKKWLAEMDEGIVTADRSGIVSGISCEAGDVITQDTSLLSYYDMQTVTIPLEIPQEEIHQIQVGDTVTVYIGRKRAEGTVSEKATEPESGTPRTSVNYEVTVSVDNSDKAYGAGISAAVTIDSEQESENE